MAAGAVSLHCRGGQQPPGPGLQQGLVCSSRQTCPHPAPSSPAPRWYAPLRAPRAGGRGLSSMEGSEAGSGRDHSGKRGGGHECARSSLRNRRGEHGVPCASYVKRATGFAANGRSSLAGLARRYANEAAPRPMEGAVGGHGAHGHVFHYVTAASQRRRRRRAALLLRAALGGCGYRRRVGAQTLGRTGGHARTHLHGECAAGRMRAGLKRRQPSCRLAGAGRLSGRQACWLRNRHRAGRGLGQAGLGSRPAGSGRRQRFLQRDPRVPWAI